MKTRYRNVAFLVELIVNILVFSISCAVLVGLFGTAGQISSAANRQAQAAAETQAMVETLKAKGSEDMPAAQQLDGAAPMVWPEAPADGLAHIYYYDKGWEQLEDGQSPDDTAYGILLVVTQEPKPAGMLEHITAICKNAAGDELYRMETAVYRPNAAA